MEITTQEQKQAKTEEVTALKEFDQGGKTIAPNSKVTLRSDQAERLADQGIVKRAK